MWLVIVVGLGILLLPLIVGAFEWITIIGIALIIISWFFHALIWLIPLIILDYLGQKWANNYYLKTGKLRWLAQAKVRK